jgi:hypothetical protein
MKNTESSNYLADLAARTKAEIGAAEETQRRSIGHAMAAGDLFIEAKAYLPHGSWGAYLKQHGWPQRTANLYMRFAKNRERIEGGDFGNVADLSIRGVDAALAQGWADDKPPATKGEGPLGMRYIGFPLSFAEDAKNPEVERIVAFDDFLDFLGERLGEQDKDRAVAHLERAIYAWLISAPEFPQMPESVFDASASWWRERKRAWALLGVDPPLRPVRPAFQGQKSLIRIQRQRRPKP